MKADPRCLLFVPLLLLGTVHLAVIAYRLRLFGYALRAAGALILAVTGVFVGTGLSSEAGLLVPILAGAGAYWLGVAMNATLEAETYRRLRKLPRSKYFLCHVEGVTPAPAQFSFWRMLFPGLAMSCGGVIWAALSPDRHQPGWGVLIFVGVLVIAFSVVLWLKGPGPARGRMDGDREAHAADADAAPEGPDDEEA